MILTEVFLKPLANSMRKQRVVIPLCHEMTETFERTAKQIYCKQCKPFKSGTRQNFGTKFFSQHLQT